MQSLKKFSPESIRAIARNPKYRLTINRNILKIRYSTSHLEHNNSKNYYYKWTQYKDNKLTKTYANLPKPQDLQTSIRKTIADILKTLKIIYI